MKCHYCGKEVWLVRHLLDGDFCSPAHRKKFHERLRHALDQLPGNDGPPAPVAAFRFVMPPADAHLDEGGRICGFQSSLPWPYPSHPVTELSPLFGQNFFAPDLQPLPSATPAGPAAALLQPAASAPRMRSFGGNWTGAVPAGLTPEQALLAVPAVNFATGAAPLPVYPPPQPWMRPPTILYPRALSGVLADGTITIGQMPAAAVPVSFGTPGKAAWLRVIPAPARVNPLPVTGASPLVTATGPAAYRACHVPPAPYVLPWFVSALLAENTVARGRMATAAAPAPLALATHPVAYGACNLHPAPCAPPRFASALLAGNTMARGSMAAAALSVPLALATRPAAYGSSSNLRPVPCAPRRVNSALLAENTMARGIVAAAAASVPLAVECVTNLPSVPRCLRVQPEHAQAPIWKLRTATPWKQAETAVQALPPRPMVPVLPGMAIAPVQPGLTADWETQPVAAAPIETAAMVSHGEAGSLPPEARAASAADIRGPEIAPVALASLQPELPADDAFVPRAQITGPRAGAEDPLAAGPRTPVWTGTLAPCMNLCALAAPLSRLVQAEPLPHAMPDFAPRGARARAHADFTTATATAVSAAMPAAPHAGFASSGFSSMVPQPAECRGRWVVPPPATVNGSTLSLAESPLSIGGVKLPSLAGSMPLEMYVQRVRSVSRKDCTWRSTPLKEALPMAMPELWPARFEQQVLQDWRRRYPARQAAVLPAPIVPRGKVLPITKHLGALGRLRQSAPHIIKGTVAAAAVSAIAWLSWSSQGLRTTLAEQQQRLHTAISQRAALVHDDNFRSGLDLWKGRKNWAHTWAYSSDGFMRTGQLALYKPTMNMRDYRMEFFAQIENRSIGWVMRAKDEQNYYAVKLAVTQPGPRPLVSVLRYPVTAGKAGKRVQIPLPIMVHNNTPYLVAVDVKGSRFRAFIENQEVDSWTDDRLRAGGVGFFSDNGEHSRVYWVKVSNNTDWLGRLCGMIAGDKHDQAGIWDPQTAGTLAVLDPRMILDSVKNADRRRGAPMLPMTAVFLARPL